jgi:transketolase
MIKKLSLEALKKKADHVRQDLVVVAYDNQAGHIGASLSTVEILTSLYYRIMNIADDPQWDDRDRFILSKAHGCYAFYSILSDLGYIKRRTWESFYKCRLLSGCVERDPKLGIEASGGSLGHGLPMAVGIAFGAKLQKKKYRIYCLVGDGEMQEGSNWEALQFAVKHELSNLTVIIDNNGLQAMDFIENILTVKGRHDDLELKTGAFGCAVRSANGHSIGNIVNILEKWARSASKMKHPQVLVAKTIKGHGLRCMENVPKFHFRVPTEDEMEQGWTK